MYMKIFSLSLLMLALVACASTPPGISIVQVPANDIALSEVNGNVQQFVGSPVRWGGRIIKVQELQSADQPQLQLEILSYPLGEQGKPVVDAASSSRFVAVMPKPEKTSTYYRNRLVTVFGLVAGSEDYTLASGEVLRLPVVNADDSYTWVDRRDDPYDRGPRVFYHFGIGNGGTRSGFGIFF